MFYAAVCAETDAAIKPAPARRGLDGDPPAAPPPAQQVPAKPAQEKPKEVAVHDPAKPSANLLKDFDTLEKIHANPAMASQAINRCENLRNGLVNYPVWNQKLHYFWGVAYGNLDEIDDCSAKLLIAAAPTAPDQELAVRALNAQAAFHLRDPARVPRVMDTVRLIITRTVENSPARLEARFSGACAFFLQGEHEQAGKILSDLEPGLRKAPSDPVVTKLREDASNLLSAVQAARAAQDPDTPPHAFYAPWRAQEARFGLGVKLRIADLAFILRDLPRALKLYTSLEKEALKNSEPEIQSWCRMQRGRLLSISGSPAESEKLLSPFLSSSPFKQAKCAPFAVLRLALLYHNHLKDMPKAEKTFDLGATRFSQTPEGNQCQYYRAMIPLLHGKPEQALPLLLAYTKDHPDHPQTAYLNEHLLPSLRNPSAAPRKTP